MESQRQSSTLHIQQNEEGSYQTQSNPKKKIIKKDKNSNKNQAKLTKEQKMKIQKQKNRQAAQRSRDQHKEYVSNLEKEIKALQQQVLVNRTLCSRCRKQLDNQESIPDNLSGQLSYEHNLFSQEDQKIQAQEQQPQINQDEYYLRVRNEQQEYSYLKMILFIAAIAIAIIIVPSSNSELQNHSRHLLERCQAPSFNTINPDQFRIHSDQKTIIDTQQPQYFTDLNKSLVVRNSILNEQCLDSLFQQRSLSLPNLRSRHPSIRGDEMKNGILLCSFEEHNQTPTRDYQGQQSNFIRMFLLGAEIKQMIASYSPITKFIENNIQLNGIYKIAAQIKQVELISHHNCLL